MNVIVRVLVVLTLALGVYLFAGEMNAEAVKLVQFIVLRVAAAVTIIMIVILSFIWKRRKKVRK